MAKKSSKHPRRNYVSSKRGRSYRHKKPEIHLLPALLETGGVLYPGIMSGDQTNGGWPGMFSSSNPTMDSKFNAFVGGLQGYTVTGNLVPAAEMIVGGMVARWIGKKTGLSKIGIKGVKIL